MSPKSGIRGKLRNWKQWNLTYQRRQSSIPRPSEDCGVSGCVECSSSESHYCGRSRPATYMDALTPLEEGVGRGCGRNWRKRKGEKRYLPGPWTSEAQTLLSPLVPSLPCKCNCWTLGWKQGNGRAKLRPRQPCAYCLGRGVWFYDPNESSHGWIISGVTGQSNRPSFCILCNWIKYVLLVW